MFYTSGEERALSNVRSQYKTRILWIDDLVIVSELH